jgi:hypothetical protein
MMICTRWPARPPVWLAPSLRRSNEQPRFLRLLDSPFPYVFGLPVSTTAAAVRVDPLVAEILRQREVLLEEAEGDVVWIDLEQGEFLPETEPLPPPHIFRDLFCFLADAAARRSGSGAGSSSSSSISAAAQLRSDCEHLRWRFAHGLAKIVFGYDRHLDRLKVGRARRFLAQKLAALNELQQQSTGTAASGGARGRTGARPSAATAGPTTGTGWSPGSPALFFEDDSSGDDADDDAPIPGFDDGNSFHRLLRAVSEAQDFQIFALKKAALYAAEMEATKNEGKVANSPEWEAFDWLCAYEERRARDHLR